MAPRQAGGVRQGGVAKSSVVAPAVNEEWCAMRVPVGVCCVVWLLLSTVPNTSVVDARKSKGKKAKKAASRAARHPSGTVQESFMVSQGLKPSASCLTWGVLIWDMSGCRRRPCSRSCRQGKN